MVSQQECRSCAPAIFARDLKIQERRGNVSRVLLLKFKTKHTLSRGELPKDFISQLRVRAGFFYRKEDEMNELDGFVVYKPDDVKGVFISASPKQIRISAEAYRRLGKPEWVNVFFDEAHKRVMIKAAEPDYPNVVHCTAHSLGKNMSMCYRDLSEKVIDMFGKQTQVHGHQVGEDTLIFDKAVKR